MIISVLVTIMIGIIAAAPGVVLVQGRTSAPGQVAAAACVSLVAVMLVTALAGMAWGTFAGGAIPAWSMIPVAVVSALACLAIRGRPTRIHARIEWEGFAVALLGIAYGLFVHALAVREADDGTLLIHAWYNADWFKHMGHVAALRNGGIPAGDIFNAMEPLHYYWLSYLLPAAGSAIGGHNYAALITAQAMIVALLCMTLYGTLRASVADRRIALPGTVLAFLLCTPTETWTLLVTRGIAPFLAGETGPIAPVLLPATLYIPQHALVLAMLLSWFLIDRPGGSPSRLLRLMALVALASAMVVSTLLGACVLAVYGLLQLWRRRSGAIAEVAIMAVGSGLLVLALQVISPGNPSSAIDSPLLTDNPVSGSAFVIVLHRVAGAFSVFGLPLVLALIVLLVARGEARDERQADGWRFAIMLIAVGIFAPVLADLALSARLSKELAMRSVNLGAIGIAIVLCWAMRKALAEGGRQRGQALAALAAMVMLATPTAIFFTSWHFNLNDRFTISVPSDDRRVLATLDERAPRDAIVWQYPEAPLLADPPGRDAWAATIAGRAVTGSLRATDYLGSTARIAAALDFFNGKPAAPISDEVGWIYLSRALHPLTFGQLVRRMQSEPGWSQAACHDDACLFRRDLDERR